MTRSMTGFGRASGTVGDEAFSVELSAVNHRFLDCSFRIPNCWSIVEPALRDVVRKHLSRGKVNVCVRRDRGSNGRQRVRFDSALAEQYVAATRELSHLINSTQALSLDVLATLDGVLYHEEDEQDVDAIQQGLTEALENALQQLDAARVQEGAALEADTRERLAAMRESVATVESRLPELQAAYQARLQSRVDDLAVDSSIKEERVAIEVAMLADKADVNEEIVRLKAHFEHAELMLASPDPVGRELSFLAQEIQREINTIGSKLRDVDVTREVLRMKSEIEKLREQAQNIE